MRSIALKLIVLCLLCVGFAASATAASPVRARERPSLRAASCFGCFGLPSTQVGSVLTTSNGTWTNNPTSFSYRWQDCNSAGANCTNIVGATASTYTLTSADVGFTIRAVVTASNAIGSASQTSVQTAVITAGVAPTSTASPVISGTATVGQVLSTTNGTWSGTTPITYTYQWARGTTCAGAGTHISGATASTYKLTSADVGFYMYAIVTATNAAGSGLDYTSCLGPVTAVSGGYTGTCTQTINPGSNVSPFTTANAMSSGQTLCLNSGSYETSPGPELDFNSSGVTVTSGPGQTATINGAEYIFGSNDTLEYLNLDEADTLYVGNGGSNPAPCPTPTSEGMIINGSSNTLQYDNIYESTYRGVLIGIAYSGTSNNDIIRYNNLGPSSSCNQTQHIIYDDYSTGLQVYKNWMFDNPYGYGVQLYTAPSNTSIYSNVFDNVLDATVELSSGSGNSTSNNVAVNIPNVPNYNSGHLVDCYGSTGPDTVNNNAIFNVVNGYGTPCSGVTATGNITLTANPFVGGANSDNYTLASNTSATQVSGYGLWNGVGPPSPNPALSYPVSKPNPGNGLPGLHQIPAAFQPPHVIDASLRHGLRQYHDYLARHHLLNRHAAETAWWMVALAALAVLAVLLAGGLMLRHRKRRSFLMVVSAGQGHSHVPSFTALTTWMATNASKVNG